MALQSLQLPMLSSSVSRIETLVSPSFASCHKPITVTLRQCQTQRGRGLVAFVGTNNKEDSVSVAHEEQEKQQMGDSPEEDRDMEYVGQIQRVLELLKKNRDMLFNEVKLTVMIEDPREIERLRLLGIEDPDSPTRDDLVAALEDVNEGRIPENRIALRVLAEEMINWPNLEVEIKRAKPRKSLYAKATDTGVDPEVAAKRLNIDWDSAAEIDDSEVKDEQDVPSLVGFGALYLVTALPVIIGVSVVLILFYNSLQ